MPRSRSDVAVALGAVAAAALTAGTAGTAGTAAATTAVDERALARAEKVEHRVVFTFSDERIAESSGLLASDRLVYTVNDSGDGPVVYAVDKRSGETVAVTTYSSGEVTDVEAIAPAGDGAAWVADIGDNDEERSTIEVYRTDPLGRPRLLADALDGRGGDVVQTAPAEMFSLRYPDEPHNAETLLVHPRTGRLYVVTKEFGGGSVFAAPRSLAPRAVNELSRVGEVPGYLVDGAFFPDGRHVMLRSYRTAAVYRFPGLREVATLRLPAQPLGEGLSIVAPDEIYLSSEGVFSQVLRILLPPEVARAVGDPSPRTALAGPTASPIPPSEVAEPPDEVLSTGDGAGLWVAAGIFVATLVGWLVFTVSRRRSRRTS